MPERLEGLDDLLATLDRLTLRQGDQVLAKALRDPSRILAEEEEHLAPHSTGKTGKNIKFSITERSPTECISRIGPSRRVFYAKFRNFGTKFQSGDHFVERAWDNKKDEVYTLLKYQLGQFIDQAVKKNG